MIADDHQILAEGIRGLLETEFEVVGVVSDGRELITAAKEHGPDVIVAEITMPSLRDSTVMRIPFLGLASQAIACRCWAAKKTAGKDKAGSLSH